MSKILLVDDETLIRQAYNDGLTREGFEVEAVENGRQAIEKLQQQKFDLLLLDLIMPEMDGFEVLEFVKNDPQLSNLPVIVLTVSGHDKDITKSRQMGAVDYLVKTEYSMKEFIHRIKFHLGES